MRPRSAPVLIGYSLGLALIAISLWGASDLWAQWSDLIAMIPPSWDCSAPADAPAEGWLAPCAALHDGRRRIIGVACVYMSTALVGAGLMALLYRDWLARSRARAAAWVGVLLTCVAGLTAMARLTLADNPALAAADRETLLRLVARETPVLAAVAGVLLAAVFVLVAPSRSE